MLSKILMSILTALHIASSSAKPVIPTPTPIPIRGQNLNVSIPDEVYADLALQHELNHVSVYYFDDNPQNTVSINSDKNWDPASTIKLYVAMYVFDQVAHGNISLDQAIVIDDKNVVPSESFDNGYASLNAGDGVTLYRLVDQMIAQSDNVAYNTLLDFLDRTKITKYIHDLGLTNSSVGAKLNLSDTQQQYELTTNGYGPNLITASDYARAFILINGNRIPGSSSLFSILARQKSNSMIPALLPKSVTVAHKTGELDPYYHDGGIVTNNNRRYVLSVFSDMGSPNIVAHISDLVYTTDLNIVGNNNSAGKIVSEIPNAPIDSLVTQGETQDTSVLAASTRNIKLPAMTASDLGIQAEDISGSLEAKQLPPIIIPSDSPFHFLVTLGQKIRTLTPIPQIKTQFEIDNLKQDLAEANDLIKRGKQNQAANILSNVNQSLSTIAKEGTVTGNLSLQTSVNKVSETRFSLLEAELNNTQTIADKTEVIKEVARQAVNTTQNIKPYIEDAVKTTSLAQIPVVGQVVKATKDSLTIKTADGTNVTTPLDTQIKTRSADQDNAQIQTPAQIPVGTTVAVTGSSFVLTNIASDSATAKPVTVLKVNEDTNSIVISTQNGIPQQVDLNSTTVIKGSDTSISLNQIQPGDVIVVHGQPIPTSTGVASATPSATPVSISPSPFVTTIATTIPTAGASATPIPVFMTPVPTPTATIKASATIKPTNTPTPKPVKPTPTPTPTKTPVSVINSNVIQVIQTVKSTPTSIKPTPTPTPNPVKR